MQRNELKKWNIILWQNSPKLGIKVIFLHIDKANQWKMQLTSHIVCSVTKLCLIYCNPMDCSLPGSSVHGIFQARILEWVAISFSRESSWSKDWTCIFCFGSWILHHWAETHAIIILSKRLRAFTPRRSIRQGYPFSPFLFNRRLHSKKLCKLVIQLIKDILLKRKK